MNRATRPLRLAGALLLTAIALLALFAPAVVPHDPAAQIDPAMSARQPPGTTLWLVKTSGPRRLLLAEDVQWQEDELVLERRNGTLTVPRHEVSNPTTAGVADKLTFLLGTDSLGRDLLSRVLAGARGSLLIAAFATLIASVLGCLIGALAGLGPAWLDRLLMALTDALLAFPVLVLLLAVGAMARPSIFALAFLLGSLSWMAIARLIRAELRSLRERAWVLQARSQGQSEARIFRHHLLPHLLPTLLIAASLEIASVVLAESALSFLGFGVRAPAVSWGSMIADGRELLVTAPWVTLVPGFGLLFTVLALHWIAGDDQWTSRSGAAPRRRQRDQARSER